MRYFVALTALVAASCGGSVDIDDNIGVIVYENTDCTDLLPCLCRSCGQSCEMCGEHDDWYSCTFCLEHVENTGDCVDLVDACL